MSNGVRGYGSHFSLADTLAEYAGRVRVVVYTAEPVRAPSVTYGGLPMACTDTGRHRAPSTEHGYEVLNPPIGAQVVSGAFDEDVCFEVRRLVDEAWPELTADGVDATHARTAMCPSDTPGNKTPGSSVSLWCHSRTP
jgi:hypothetical protein